MDEEPRSVYFTDANSSPELFKAIGHFIFQFSQLEFVIRHALASALGLKSNKDIDTVTSPYDFRVLCDVTSGYLRSLFVSDREFQEQVKKLFDRCKSLNDDRVRVAHGTWMVDGGTRHVSRGSLTSASYFMTPGELEGKTQEAFELMRRVIELSLGRVMEVSQLPNSE
ncbi:hypothetical protein [Bradyrhizobium australafricanum]|uniref:hypothetical protein n=1 Tax=Bradyrhizobium australafricanum TaxID=2821406 RepID=UPI001CE31746|nr:hypothetical protein [Bradyrhizobium australafricanum]MCA6104755.1 hypothetical protein [Bradyrhizobium australafricanum]